MQPRPTFYILDAYSLIYQVFHAIPLMTGPAGQPTHAVFGIFRDLLNLLRDRKPDYLAAAFDGAGPVFRSELFADYKAQRAAMPDDLVPQIAVIRRVFEGFRVPVADAPGGRGRRRDRDPGPARRGARARRLHLHRRQGRPATASTTTSGSSTSGSRRSSTPTRCKADWGVTPEQVVDLLSLTGDTSDNVPGVPGIGLKTGGQAARGVRRPRQPAGQPRQGLGRQAQGEPPRPRRDGPAGPAAHHPPRRPRPGPRLGGAPDDAPPTSRRCRALCIECGFHRFLAELPTPDKAAPAEWVADYRSSTPPRRSPRSWPSCDASPGSASTPRRPRSTRSAPTSSGCRSAGRRARRITCRSGGRSGSQRARPRRRRSRRCGRS